MSCKTKRDKKKQSEYSIWQGMKNRCFNKKVKDYKSYGGRGIKVCDRWLNFNEFLEDITNEIGRRPSMEHEIDRINNNGNYEPGNVRWVLSLVQHNNKRNNIWVTFEGKTQTVSQWARELGWNPSILHHRLKRHSIKKALFDKPYKQITFNGKTQTAKAWSAELGISSELIQRRLLESWSIEKALTTPHRTIKNAITFNGKTQSIKDWAKELNMVTDSLHKRLNMGWSIEKALTQQPKRGSKVWSPQWT
jgi:hypothetical protein